MIKNVFKILYNKVPYEIKYDKKKFNLHDNKKIEKFYVVKINRNKIKFYNRIFINWSRPIYLGKIEQDEKGYKINGYFRMLLMTRIIFTYCFGLLIIIIFILLISLVLISEHPIVLLGAIVGLIIFYGAYLLLRYAEKRYYVQIDEMKYLIKK